MPESGFSRCITQIYTHDSMGTLRQAQGTREKKSDEPDLSESAK